MKNHLKFPTDKPFTLKMILAQQNLIKDTKKKISKVGLFLKVKREVAKGNLMIVGKKKTTEGRGRAQLLFKVVPPVVIEEHSNANQESVNTNVEIVNTNANDLNKVDNNVGELVLA